MIAPDHNYVILLVPLSCIAGGLFFFVAWNCWYDLRRNRSPDGEEQMQLAAQHASGFVDRYGTNLPERTKQRWRKALVAAFVEILRHAPEKLS